MNRLKLLDQLTVDEAVRLKPYRDTEGHLTIGIGRNLDVGITLEEARFLAVNDIVEKERDLGRRFPEFTSLDDVRQRVLVNLAFNLGVTGLLGFPKMMRHVAAREFEAAAAELQDSHWYTQVGRRGPELVQMLLTGKDPA